MQTSRIDPSTRYGHRLAFMVMPEAMRLASRLVLLERSQWKQPEQLEAQQQQLVRRLLIETAHTPFYREMFARHRVNVNSGDAISELRKLPPASKRILREVPLRERMTARSHRLVTRTTSGSTGEPYTVALSPHEKNARVLVELRMLRAHGVGARDLMFTFRRNEAPERGLIRESYLGLYPRVSLPSAATVEERIGALFDTRPAVLKSIPSALLILSREMARRQLSPPRGLRLIVSSAEPLTDESRAEIESVLQVHIVDHYGSVEFGFLAWQCPEFEGFHVNGEDFLIELLDEHGTPVAPGEAGEVAVTGLLQRTVPHLRFLLGDKAQWMPGRCRCGRGLPRMKLLAGRTTDILYLADGTAVQPHVAAGCLLGVDNVLQFQVVQEQWGKLLVRYVPRPGAINDRIDEAVRKRLGQVFPHGMEIEFQPVHEILPNSSGKLPVVVSTSPQRSD